MAPLGLELDSPVPSRGMRLLRLCCVNRDGQEEVGFGTRLPPQNLEWRHLYILYINPDVVVIFS